MLRFAVDFCVIVKCEVGILACLDGYMNIAMEQTEEYVNGQLKNKYGDAFIRGNNGEQCNDALFIQLSIQIFFFS